VLRAQPVSLVQRGVGERLQRQARELRIDPCIAIIHATRTYRTPSFIFPPDIPCHARTCAKPPRKRTKSGLAT